MPGFLCLEAGLVACAKKSKLRNKAISVLNRIARPAP